MRTKNALKIIRRLEPIARTYPSRSKQRKMWYQSLVMCGDKYERPATVSDDQINGLRNMLKEEYKKEGK